MARPHKLVAALATALVLTGATVDGWVWWHGQSAILSAPRGEAPALLVVPGASVFRNGNLSPVLKERLDAALLASRAWPQARLLLSGTSIPRGYDEVQAMRHYAIGRGFDSTRIYLDRHGDNSLRTVELVGRILRPGQRAVLVSQSWHLPRCLWLGKRYRLQGLACDREGLWKSLPYRLREHLARPENFLHAILP